MASEPAKVRRFALIVGANNGGNERVVLRYAKSDAQAFAKVLTEIGGVQKQDELMVLESSRGALLRGFHQMRERLVGATASGTRLELVFYYSGHSDERGLLLGDETLEYRVLKKELNQLPARVKIGILDSCASGALVRIKGGRRTAPFLVDASNEVSGYALLTSSSADENAQESERIGASFFTHYLISGLRGAADTNRDGQVTLSESYAYAFDETLQRTVSSRGGAQHPNYDFQLAGAGDLVLTDLRSTDAVLGIPANLSGRVYVRDAAGRLLAEINKTSGRHVKIALPRGKYEVSVASNGVLKRGTVRLTPGSESLVDLSTLVTIKRSGATNRGGAASADDGDDVSYRTFAATLLHPSFTTNPKGRVENRFAVNVVGGGYALRGVEAGLVLNKRAFSVRGIQYALLMNRTHHLVGLQRGMLNFADGDVKGVQIGMVNMAGASARGAQFGMFNAAKEDSRIAQFGFINYMPDGLFSFGAWTSDTALFNFGFKIGGRYTFSKLTFGTRGYGDDWVSMGYGFGGHFDAKRVPLWLEIDLTAHWLCSDLDDIERMDLLIKHKVAFGIRLYDTFSLFAGPLLNGLMSSNRDTVAVAPVLASGETDTFRYEISPGFFAGFQVEPKLGRFNTYREVREE